MNTFEDYTTKELEKLLKEGIEYINADTGRHLTQEQLTAIHEREYQAYLEECEENEEEPKSFDEFEAGGDCDMESIYIELCTRESNE